jgi:hypothetical protein
MIRLNHEPFETGSFSFPVFATDCYRGDGMSVYCSPALWALLVSSMLGVCRGEVPGSDAAAKEAPLEAIRVSDDGKGFVRGAAAKKLLEFVDQSAGHADGWISFYWGQTAAELRGKESPSMGEAITASWLEAFQAASTKRVEDSD